MSHFRFGVLCVLTYVALSWAARFDTRGGDQNASLFYPLDTFSMYAGVPGEYMSHLLVRDAQGSVHRVTSYRSFQCVEPIRRGESKCSETDAIAYHYDDLVNYIEGHPGHGDQNVELINRTWRIVPQSTPSVISDCVVAHCEASR